MPDTGQEIDGAGGDGGGGTGVQAPTVTPAGRPEMLHVADVALAVAVALLRHRIVPV